MRTSLDCYPCFVRQALDAARQVSDDPAVHAQAVRDVCQFCTELDLSQSPPAIGQQVHRIVRRLTGSSDPYARVKERFNRLGMLLRDRLRPRLADADDPFDAAVRLAIAGNSIDFGARDDLTEEETTALTDQAFTRPLNGQTRALKRAAARARQILFLADNAGEIALDVLLVEQLPLERTTVAVRGRPIINDATLEDARAVGLADLVPVIDNGSDAPGTLLEDCSRQFLDALGRADLVISKGQGNYESLSDCRRRNIYYLLIPKCKLVVGRLGCRLGSFVVRSGDEHDAPTPQGEIDENSRTD